MTASAIWSAAIAAPPGSADEVRSFQASSAPIQALVDVNVIDGTGGPARAHQTVIIREGRIASVGPAASTPIPAGAEEHRLGGDTVLPGLVMLHEHMMYFSGFRTWHSQAVSFPRLYLAAGVTTLRTAGGDTPMTDLNLKLAIDEGRSSMAMTIIFSATISSGAQPMVSERFDTGPPTAPPPSSSIRI
jgi:imidazolonepropionase-like amidohydrolase